MIADDEKVTSLKIPSTALHLFLGGALLAVSFAPVQAQTTPDPLFRTIQSLDTELFDAYNHCDLKRFAAMLDDDLEFYHDLGGFSRGKQPAIDGVKNNICGKVTRELVPGTLEVYPIAHFGAVEIGVHRFHHPGHEGTEPVGEAKFIHIWQNQDGAWKLTRIISFDHHALTK
jgi:ketosteroid isomerase-like protein